MCKLNCIKFSSVFFSSVDYFAPAFGVSPLLPYIPDISRHRNENTPTHPHMFQRWTLFITVWQKKCREFWHLPFRNDKRTERQLLRMAIFYPVYIDSFLSVFLFFLFSSFILRRRNIVVGFKLLVCRVNE